MIELFNEDCLQVLNRQKSKSIDMLIQDTPFGVTQNKWDIKPDLKVMWPEWERVIKDNGAILFFATQPFASELVMSNPKIFKYDLIWEKSRASGFLNANRMPLRNHETILIFYRRLGTYNPQKWKGKPNHVKHGTIRKSKNNNNYGAINPYKQTSTEDKHPVSVLFCEQQDPNKITHPTQKPLDLFRYLIKTYTNEGDTVFDGYAGSGTTAAACIMEKRNAICCENDPLYYNNSIKRLNLLKSQLTCF